MGSQPGNERLVLKHTISTGVIALLEVHAQLAGCHMLGQDASAAASAGNKSKARVAKSTILGRLRLNGRVIWTDRRAGSSAYKQPLLFFRHAARFIPSVLDTGARSYTMITVRV